MHEAVHGTNDIICCRPGDKGAFRGIHRGSLQFRIGPPAVGVGFDHPGVADVGENDDLVFDVQGQDPHQLRNCPMGHAGVLHGTVVGFLGDL